MKTFRQALVAIVTADATIRTLCNRTTKLCVGWRHLPDVPLPALGFLIVDEHRTGQAGEHWEPQLQLTAVADDTTGAEARCEDLLKRAMDILAQPAFVARGVDAAPLLPWHVREGVADLAAHELGVSRLDGEVRFNVKLA